MVASCAPKLKPMTLCLAPLVGTLGSERALTTGPSNVNMSERVEIATAATVITIVFISDPVHRIVTTELKQAWGDNNTDNTARDT